jgi:hypothetical protein
MDPAFESVPHDRLPETKRAFYRFRRPERSPFYAVLNPFVDPFPREYGHRFGGSISSTFPASSAVSARRAPRSERICGPTSFASV